MVESGGERTILGRIRARYAALSPAERLLADTILDFPGEIASYSATELAARAGVSKATVTRLIHRLGFADFEEARLLSREGSEAGSPLFLMRQEGDAPPAVEAHFAQAVSNLHETLAGLDRALLDAATDALATAHAVWLVGFRNNHFLAGYARWQFVQVRDGVHLLPAAGETLGESLAGIGPEDLVMILGVRRRVRILDRIATAVGATGAKILLIADSHSPLPPATWAFRCATRSLAPLDDHAAVLALLHVLAAELLTKTGAAGRLRLRRIEALHEELGEI